VVGDMCPSLPSGRELHLIDSKKEFFATEASAKCSSDAPNHKYALQMYGKGERTAFKIAFV